MKSVMFLLAAAAPLLVSANNWLFNPLSGDQTALAGGGKIPGVNPLEWCEPPKNHILQIDSVDLTPAQPMAGHPLGITAKGKLNKDIEDGAKIRLQVKFGVITLLRQEAKLCDYVDQVNMSCPLQAGDVEITKEVTLPKHIPAGKYSIQADVYTKDHEKITCLEGHMTFLRGGE